jgi:hypothetical protein
VLSVALDGQPQPIPSSAASLPLPVIPGEHQAEITWEAPIASGTSIRTSTIELPGRAYNIALHLTLPSDRWPLFVAVRVSAPLSCTGA